MISNTAEMLRDRVPVKCIANCAEDDGTIVRECERVSLVSCQARHHGRSITILHLTAYRHIVLTSHQHERVRRQCQENPI